MERKHWSVSLEQRECLFHFLEAHPDIAQSIDRGLEGRQRTHLAWSNVAADLNCIRGGARKTPKAWRAYFHDLKFKAIRKMKNNREMQNSERSSDGGLTKIRHLTESQKRLITLLNLDNEIPQNENTTQYWNDYKCKIKTRLASLNNPFATEDSSEPKPFTEIELRFVNIIQDDSQTQGEGSTRKKRQRGRGPSANFKLVKKRCVELVKSGYPSAIIDDEHFQAILSLIPMSSENRKELTAENIQKKVEDRGQDETQMEEDDDDDDDDDPLQAGYDDDDDDQDTTIRHVKIEVEPEECTCAVRDPGAHELTCPQAAKMLPFLNYYEIADHEAKCTLCRDSFGWSEVAELKSHLDNNHPNIRYEDTTERPEYLDSSDASYFDDPGEVVRVISKPGREEGGGGGERRTKGAKGGDHGGDKFSGEDKFCFSAEREDEFVPPRKRPRFAEVKLKNNERISVDEFRLLDRFGLYVAALLETLPKEKCLRYQQQIVEKLLKEQAAAG